MSRNAIGQPGQNGRQKVRVRPSAAPPLPRRGALIWPVERKGCRSYLCRGAHIPSCRAGNVDAPSALTSPVADGSTTRLPPVPRGRARLLGRLSHVEVPFLLANVIVQLSHYAFESGVDRLISRFSLALGRDGVSSDV